MVAVSLAANAGGGRQVVAVAAALPRRLGYAVLAVAVATSVSATGASRPSAAIGRERVARRVDALEHPS